MKKQIITEKEVKQALAIDDFRNVTKEKLVEFVSMIPNMDKEVAISIINQFPDYKEFAVDTLGILRDMYDMALEKSEVGHKEVLSAYRKIVDDLGEQLKKENLTAEERDSISNKMIMCADKMAEVDAAKRNWIERIWKAGLSILGVTLITSATILGVNIKGKNIPQL